MIAFSKILFFLSLVKALDITLPLMTIPYLTRVLSVNEFGSLIVCMAAYSMANILTDFGFLVYQPLMIYQEINITKNS
ncbi:oligosaccharide flippase family protein [Providencia huaxiensis]|uniref:oligosaccharide flippase family protein n=1 Tax=Providencia huaxiensis TaxID=2027290 RepID=UPI0034DD5921